MKSGVPWQVSGVRRDARETAREAARRAGMSVGEWLDTVIRESTEADYAETGRELKHDQDEFSGNAEDASARRSRYPEDDERLQSAAGEHRSSPLSRKTDNRAHSAPDQEAERDFSDNRGRPPRHAPEPAQMEPDTDPRAELEQRLPLGRDEDRPAMHRGFIALHQRLDDLTHQLTEVATLTAAKAQPREEPPKEWVEMISKLDRRLDQLIAEGRSSKSEIEHRVNAVDRAIADLNREPARASAPSAAATPLDQALAQIADRQRALDGYAPTGQTATPTRSPAASESLPRPRTQELSGLEQQLREVNAEIE
ncbi:MAG: hypothetical protein E6G96_05820, partial [Alphaproteobacteria bacterium]